MGNRYLLFLGCAIPYRVSGYEISSRKVLAKLGVELVEMPEFNCCGLPLDPVSHETMLILAAKNLALAEQQNTQRRQNPQGTNQQSPKRSRLRIQGNY
jgi:heterodisulfide reductase subunit B